MTALITNCSLAAGGDHASARSVRLGNTSVFSSETFVRVWVGAIPGPHGALPILVRDAGPARTMYAVQTTGRFSSRRIGLAPDGLYASPGWEGVLERNTIANIVRQLRTVRTERFTWNVRFDHEPLAARLIELGLVGTRHTTQVLDLQPPYDRVFAGFNRTIRNQIHQATRKGVEVRPISGPEDVIAYYDVHARLAEQQGTYKAIYPVGLFLELAKLQGVVDFLVATCEGRVVSGGVFFRDGSSVMHWHGATDRAYSRYFPACAVLGAAMQWACESGATTFNLGGSAGIASLEQFKSFWGAQWASNWQFTWNNPFWTVLRGGAALARRLTSPFR